MKMNCKQYRERVFGPELTIEDRDEALAMALHVGKCPYCQEWRDQFRRRAKEVLTAEEIEAAEREAEVSGEAIAQKLIEEGKADGFDEGSKGGQVFDEES